MGVKTAAAAVAAAAMALGGGAAYAAADPAHHSALAGIDMPADATLQSTDADADSGGTVIKTELWKYSGSYDATVNYFKAHMPSSYRAPGGRVDTKTVPHYVRRPRTVHQRQHARLVIQQRADVARRASAKRQNVNAAIPAHHPHQRIPSGVRVGS